MIPSITSFVEALRAPHEHFSTLQGIEPLMRNGEPVVRRSSLFVEAEVSLNGRNYLLFAPLAPRVVVAASRTISLLEQISSDYLCDCHVYYAELKLHDDLDREFCCDVILQWLPEGEIFDVRYSAYSTDELCDMLRDLEAEHRRLHFSHNNLLPKNIIIGTDQRLHPIRYHYATIGSECRDDFESLLCEVKAASVGGLIVEDCVLDYDASDPRYDEVLMPHEGLMRACHNGLFGFIGYDMEPVIPLEYLWVEDFYENRAVVESEQGMGVIDRSGNIIVPLEYEELRYSYSQGEFIARKALDVKIFDYNGHIKRF